MPPPFPSRLSDVAAAIADGAPVDWLALESGASSDEERQYLGHLKVIADVTNLQAGGTHAESQFSSVDGIGRALTRHDAPIYRPGSLWGHLRILALVGSGRYGVVYRAWDPKLEREVALKLLRHRDVANGSEVVHEARLMARVHHQNVVTVYGADSRDGQVGLWMQFIEGRTLEAELRANGDFSTEQLRQVGSELCEALAAVHRAGLVHRDVKPQNILRDRDGRLVLGDFGTGRLLDDVGESVAGTPLFLAPELLHGAPASQRSDVYALGVTMYHLATRAFPVFGRSIADLRDAHDHTASKALASVRPDLTGPIAAAIERAIAPDPEHRWASAEAMRDVLIQPARLKALLWRGRTVAVAAIAVVVAAVAAASVWMPRSNSSIAGPAVALAERPWVLVAASDNRTGNKDLDGVLEYALERELIGSPRFRVAARARVDDVLRLMRRSPDSRLDESSAREVALRDGGIATVIGGRLDTIGQTTVLSASVIDVSSGTALTHLSEKAPASTDLQPAILRLSNRLRLALGDTESSTGRPAPGFERVTTPSLKALRLYSESYAAGGRDHWPAALALAQEAVSEDATFAAAHTWLAWALFRNQLPSEQYLAAAATAVRLSSNASEWERLWIKASFHSLNDNVPEAQGALEALLRLYPDHLWAVNNLVISHTRAAQYAQALEPAIRLAELRPRDYNSLYLAFDTCRRMGMPEKAAGFAHRIKELRAYNRQPRGDAWVFDAFLAWHRGTPKLMGEELRKVQDQASALDQELRDAVLARASMLWLAAGRPTDAASVLGPTAAVADPQLALAKGVIAHSTGDVATAKREALSAQILDVPAGGTNASEIAQWALASWLVSRTGDASDVRIFYSQLKPNAQRRSAPQGPAALNIMDADLALAQGRTAEVISRLAPQSAWNNLQDSINFRAAETLADALSRTGDNGAAARSLEKALASGHIGAPDAAYWQLRCQVRLSELYQVLGRDEDAAKLAATVANLLTEAEPGFAIAERARAVLAVREPRRSK